jgi:hypothetical protein
MVISAVVKLIVTATVLFDSSSAFHSVSKKSWHGRIRAIHRAAVVDEIALAAADDVETSSLLKTKTSSTNLVENNANTAESLGPQILSVADCKKELLRVIANQTPIEGDYRHNRIEYLTKYLELSYTPIQTIPFLNYVLSGRWDVIYSNVLIRGADSTFHYRISQEITANESEGKFDGFLKNLIKWDLKRADEVCSGDLVVNSKYELNTKGDLNVALLEHLLMPNGDAPKNVEELIMTVQRSIPFEFFDPDGVLIQNTVSVKPSLSSSFPV